MINLKLPLQNPGKWYIATELFFNRKNNEDLEYYNTNQIVLEHYYLKNFQLLEIFKPTKGVVYNTNSVFADEKPGNYILDITFEDKQSAILFKLGFQP